MRTCHTPAPIESAITLAELATALNVSERVVVGDLRDGRLSGTKIGNSWRFTRSDLEAYLGIKRTRDLFGPRPTDAFGIPPELIA